MRVPRTLALRLIAVAAAALAAASPVRAQEPYFPKSVFLPKNEEVNAIIDEMTSVHLRAMKEPSLWKLSRKDSTATAYRFLWLATGEHPICIRLHRIGETFTLHISRHDGPPGLTAGRQNVDKDVKVSVPQGEQLLARLQKTTFWTAPVEVKENRGIADGDEIVIEGAKGGQYHVICRAGTAAGESYKGFCRSLLELAGEPAALKAWDDRREKERKSSGYRPEPPQTEDRGDQESDR
jgi:bifunctional DNA-binding transcriptional regulator/antitoxin component of YhaV-PrlF toxin-antitoxin module